MSTEITTTRPGSVVEKQEWARALAPSRLLPQAYRDNPANLFLAAEFADALGIERINALTSIHVIEGKPSASADLMAALVRRAGHRLRVTGNDQAARAVLIRADDPEFEYVAEWDLSKARQAGLVGKGVWTSYPAAMLRSRAITEVCRMAASDALLGVIYSPEELGAEVDGAGQPTRPTHVTAGRVTAAELLGQEEVPAEPEAPAEVIEDAEVVEPGITPAQSKRLHTLVTRLDMDRDTKLAGLSRIAGREITSSKDLTETEAAWAIDGLAAKVAALDVEGGA
ncbi:hypothetical protein QUV83_16265 [Cellulomonas cellasea]|uniref:hypothetical protein n=1 Tax=Cellulomonas cellasea TaxID=43670 RepID=UPI0025A3E710|nr:hypothetical protein [Cellulomonas cellasea]MDM8086330.1 hypothetical protein [Cellulomonas cellasea]